MACRSQCLFSRTHYSLSSLSTSSQSSPAITGRCGPCDPFGCSYLSARLCLRSVSPAVMLAQPTVVCWTGYHNVLATVALVTFTTYLPLSIMLGVYVCTCLCCYAPSFSLSQLPCSWKRHRLRGRLPPLLSSPPPQLAYSTMMSLNS